MAIPPFVIIPDLQPIPHNWLPALNKAAANYFKENNTNIKYNMEETPFTGECVGDRILICPTEKEDRTLPNGFKIPGSSISEGVRTGIVMHVGPKQYSRNKEEGSQIKEGYTVLFGVNSFLEITLNDKAHYVGKDTDVIFILSKNNK